VPALPPRLVSVAAWDIGQPADLGTGSAASCPREQGRRYNPATMGLTRALFRLTRLSADARAVASGRGGLWRRLWRHARSSGGTRCLTGCRRCQRLKV